MDHRPADAEAHDQKLLDAEVVHQPKVVIGMGVPGPVNLKRAARLPWVSVAQVNTDTTEILFVSLHRVEGYRRIQQWQRGIEPAAWNDQQGISGPYLFVVDTDGFFFIKRHGLCPPLENRKTNRLSVHENGIVCGMNCSWFP